MASPDKGVTASTIKVGTVTDKGSTIRPGLDVEMYDTAVAFTKWCNAHGGILGRKLSLTDLDAKLFNYPAAVTKGCQEDFAMVGGGAAIDDGDNGARVKCGLPNIAGYTVSAQGASRRPAGATAARAGRPRSRSARSVSWRRSTPRRSSTSASSPVTSRRS